MPIPRAAPLSLIRIPHAATSNAPVTP